MKPIIVGQAPSRNSDPSEPLSGRSGKRLAMLCGCTVDEFMQTFDRRNMIDYWPGSNAAKGDGFILHSRARIIAESLKADLRGRRVILLGRNVSNSFRVPFPLFEVAPLDGMAVSSSPHPSGVNLWFNEKDNIEKACRFWRALYLTVSA